MCVANWVDITHFMFNRYRLLGFTKPKRTQKYLNPPSSLLRGRSRQPQVFLNSGSQEPTPTSKAIPPPQQKKTDDLPTKRRTAKMTTPRFVSMENSPWTSNSFCDDAPI